MEYTTLLLILAALTGAWNVFEKAGRRGWEALIPVYNLYVLTVITGQPWWLLVLCVIPFINIVAMTFLYLKLAERFGLGWPFAVGLLFLPFIFFPILGFGEAAYASPPRS